MPKGSSQRDANEKLGELEKQVRHDVSVAPGKMPLLTTVADDWLEVKKPNIRYSTYEQYKGACGQSPQDIF
jgi:hypothetical protein